MTRTALLALLLLQAIAPEAARAHGGTLDADGCHTDRKSGELHCHRKPGEVDRVFRETCDVVRVVDGDTLDVRCPGNPRVERVRLLGLDAPERGDPGAAAARDRLARASGGRVTLTLRGLPETPIRDGFGRLLATEISP